MAASTIAFDLVPAASRQVRTNMSAQLIGHLTLVAFVVLVSQLTNAKVLPPDECPTLQHCIVRIYEVADADPGLSLPEQALVRRLAEFGESAVPDLVDMLTDPDEAAAVLAAAALRGIERIDPEFLPEIIAGLDRGLEWLAGALGRIDTNEAAAEAVTRFLASSSSPHNQEAFAIRLLGAKAIPHIVDAARCSMGGCDEMYYYILGHVLGSLEADRTKAAKELFSIARDAPFPDVSRGALLMISKLGEDGRVLEKDLMELRQARPALTEQVADALIGIRSKFAGKEFERRLIDQSDAFESILSLRDLAEVGPIADWAAPAVADLLQSPELDLRLAAARTLGFIGYQGAIEALVSLLGDPVDARINWVAAESLGRLRAVSALDALEATAEQHWYPPIRDAATKAIANITSSTEYLEEEEDMHFPFHYFAYEQMGLQLENCQDIPITRLPDAPDIKLFPSDDPALFDTFSSEDPYRPGPNIPDFAVKVSDGWLAGTDVGEWGGDLIHFREDGTSTLLLHENVMNIHRFGDAFVVVTGIAHLTLNRGALYQLSHDPDLGWQTTVWRRLPGAPISSWLVDSGELLVNVYGGSILIDPSGSMRMAPCAD